MFTKIKNESQTDRIIRFILGIVFAIIGYAFLSGTVQIVFYILAFIALFTSVTGFCPLYKVFGIKTLK